MDLVSKAWFKAKEALLAQGEQSLDSEGHCMYRGKDGAKCFVGHLIDDEHYSYRLEGAGVNDCPIITVLKASGWEFSDKELEILDLGRSIHDHRDVWFWEEDFAKVEKDCGLVKGNS